VANYVLNDEKMFCDIADGIAIVINSETGIYYGMNALGTQVFENMLNGASSGALLAALQNLPGAPADMPGRLEEFIAILLDKELVREGPAGGDVAVTLDAETAQSNAFALEAREYDDAQELLLADPIHEVKESTGWKPDKEALETDEAVVADKHAKIQK
jgi:hypothetical protein